MQRNVLRHLVFAVALFTVVFLPAAPAKADGWTLNHITDTGNGDSTGQDPRMPTGPIDLGETDYPPFYLPMEVVEYNDDITSNINVQYQPVYVWSSSTGAPPPKPSIFKVTVNAEGNTVDPDGAPVAANDGFGDTSPTDTEYDVYSSGLHLIQVTPQQSGSEWTATLAPTEMSASGGRYEPSSHVDFTVAPDTRSLLVSGAFGQTYHKDSTTGDRDANEAAGGVLTDDTLALEGFADPDNGTYTENDATDGATTGGAWLPDSTYHWNEKTGGASSSGTFSPGGIGSFTWQFDQDNANTQDHIFLSAYDSDDGAEETANYYVNFHNQWENFVPDSLMPTSGFSITNLDSTQAAVNSSNVTIGPATYSLTLSEAYTAGVNLTGGFTVANLGNFGVTYSGSLTNSSSETVSVQSPPIPPQSYVTPYYVTWWTDNNYLVDEYGTDGFDNTWMQQVPVASSLGGGVGWSAAFPLPK